MSSKIPLGRGQNEFRPTAPNAQIVTPRPLPARGEGGNDGIESPLPGLVMLLLAALLIAACSSQAAPVITATPPATATHTPPPTDPRQALPIPPPLAPGVNPLTGRPVDTPGALDRRPLAVKISNAPAVVRPQAGIGQADLVFEHYTEGSLTRLTAIFWTHTPPRVGSVRSARLIDLELPTMYGALFAYAGAAEPIRQRIAALPFAPRAYEGVTTGAPLYFRDPGIDAPHNLFVIPAEVWQRASAQGINTPPALAGMVFADDPPSASAPAAQIALDYGPDVVGWRYDADAGQYVRTVNSEPHTDANTGQPVTAANVVVIYAHHQPDYTIVESEWQGRKDYSIEIQIWTLGPAAIFRDGRQTAGYWMRWEEEAMLTFWADEAGTQPLALKPGNTWFQVVPLDFGALEVTP